MTQSEKEWVTDAQDLCSRAELKGLLMLVARNQGENDEAEADIVITNAKDAKVINALVKSHTGQPTLDDARVDDD